MSSRSQTSDFPPLTYTTPNRLVTDFASRGIVILAPEDLGIPTEVHKRVYDFEKKALSEKKRVTTGIIPDVLEILNAPGLVSACDQLAGKNWAIVPFTHNAVFTSGPRDQHWHKDDNGPYNSRKQRHHQAVQLEMLYYPQEVTAEMGATATIPYSQYWTFNHEENHDNFAGADHLDFAYFFDMQSEHVSGPKSKYDIEDIVNQRTAHDIRMRDAVTNTQWPLVLPFEAGPLRAGSVIIYSHNTFHRGNHRRDDWRTWDDNPRFMWRFWLYRTTDPSSNGSTTIVPMNDLGIDPITSVNLSEAPDDVTEVWRYHHHWIKTGQAPPPRPESESASPEQKEREAEALFEQLHTKYDEAEPTRIGAAYKFASIGDPALATKFLGRALHTDRENVRRAATYGLIAVGPHATDTLIEATRSPIKWIRKAGVYGLGDASHLTQDVLDAVTSCLHNDSSVYVRSVAAGTLGCLGRRAVATSTGIDLIPACIDALLQSLSREKNRPSMDKAQGRSIKFVRPTDDCDVCEGGGVDFGLDRFEPVRSAVRENALWSIVILCSHGTKILGNALEPTIETLKDIIRTDKNVIDVGYAMDALIRLVKLNPDGVSQINRENLLNILKELPVHSWETFIRGGLSLDTVSEFNNP